MDQIDILQLAALVKADLVYGVFTVDLLSQVLSDCGADVPLEFALDRAYLIGRIGVLVKVSTYFLTNYRLNGQKHEAPSPTVTVDALQAPAIHFTPEEIAQLRDIMRQVDDGSIPVVGEDRPLLVNLPPMLADILEIDDSWRALIHHHHGVYARISEGFRMQKQSPSKADQNAYKSICLSATQKLANKMRFQSPRWC